MATKVLVPELGESVVEATVGNWLVKEGDVVAIGDILVELETDKVDLEVNSDVAGVLVKIERQVDDDVEIGDVLAIIEASDGAAPPAAKPAPAKVEALAPAAPKSANGEVNATPVAKRVAASEGVDIAQVSGTGKGGKVTKSDVASASAPAPTPAPKPVAATEAVSELAALLGGSAEKQTRVKMSRRRRTIAKRLIEAQETAAMLTTFNEIDMSAVMELRTRRKAWFLEKTGAKLGYTSFFTKAAISALKAYPRINAEIDGDEMVLKHHYDIGIAVGADEGLVVPVLRNADAMSFANIESKVREMALAARDGTLALGDLMGGTFTITNGGVFGSMLSTPILNPPQVAILGLHNIVERPVAVDGEVVIRPIMYAALTYDHRIVDGSEAVRFLVHIKELIEDPEDLLLAG